MHKILVVDDEPDLLNAARIMLEREKYQVVTASNGGEALQKVEVEMPDLVLLDVVMPVKSGLDVCRTLKSQAVTKRIPIVMFTAQHRYIDVKLYEEAGADGFLNKPFSSKDLLKVIKEHLKETD